MAWETTEIGLIAELKLKRFGRFIVAGFLACWLTGWAVSVTLRNSNEIESRPTSGTVVVSLH